jgi:hypothetical protein
LSAVVDNDRIWDSELKNDVLDEIYNIPGADFGQGLHLDALSKLINHDKQVGQTLAPS